MRLAPYMLQPWGLQICQRQWRKDLDGEDDGRDFCKKLLLSVRAPFLSEATLQREARCKVYCDVPLPEATPLSIFKS